MAPSQSIKSGTSLCMGVYSITPKGIVNILGLSNVADNDKYWVHYDSRESKDFIVTRIKDGKGTRF